jgi:DNA topoisomerase-1
MPGRCPKCDLRILKRTSKNGYTYYACEKLKECGFITWDVPVADDCPECGQTQFKLSGKGFRKPFCINEKCPNFLPEDKRGYRKKKEDNAEETGGKDTKTEGGKTTAKSKSKSTANKKSSTKTATSAKKASSTTSKTAASSKKTSSTTKKSTSTKKSASSAKKAVKPKEAE